MPEATHAVRVTGTVSADADEPMLVLSQRLDGYDTFLTGRLQLGDAPPIAVRILTFDDVTVLLPLDTPVMSPAEPWAGRLLLPHGWRTRAIPDDLATAALSAHRSLDALDEAELRYAITFLGEASTDAIRQARIDAIVNALPQLDPAP